MTPLVEINNVTKTYRIGSSEVKALDGVSLTVCEGEFIVLTGPSGSGKSTLLHLMGFLDSPDSGDYRFAGSSTRDLGENQLAAIRSRMTGFVFQSFHLLAKATAAYNVSLPMIYSGGERRPQKALKCLKLVGLADRAGHRPNELSGGEQQRVAIARALINDPFLILADEPTGNLDSKSREDVISLLKTLNDRGMTVVIVTHDPEVAAKARRTVGMRDGKIVSDEKTGPQTRHVPTAHIRMPKSRRFLSLDELAEQARSALISLWSHKTRSFLTMLGILVGVASIIAMITMAEGLNSYILSDIGDSGAKTILVIPAATRSGKQGRLSMTDVRDIRDNCPSVSAVSPNVQAYARIIRGNKNTNETVFGAAPGGLLIKRIKKIKGRSFTADENARRARVAVITHKVAEKLFEKGEEPVDRNIRINKISFRIIGVLPKGGIKESMTGSGDVIIPLNTAMKRMFGETRPAFIEIEALSPDHVESAEKEITQVLRRNHGITGGKKDDFTVLGLAAALEGFKKVVRILSIVLSGIAAISLLVGGIGIMNIMLVSVTERTREIGLRKALGARKVDVLSQFLIEAIVLCLIGGMLGIGLGFAIGKIQAIFSELQPVLTLKTTLGACLFSSVIGVVFGFWPAMKAALMNPIDALRYE